MSDTQDHLSMEEGLILINNQVLLYTEDKFEDVYMLE